MHVPLAIRFPQGDNDSKTRRVRGVCSPMDMMPTILDYLDIRSRKKTDAKSIMPLLSGNEDKDRIFFYEYPNHAMPAISGPDIYAARSATHKLMRVLQRGTNKILQQGVFDITSDPSEQKPIRYDSLLPIHRQLSDELDKMVEKARNYKLPFKLVSYEMPIGQRQEFVDKRKNQPDKIIKELSEEQIKRLRSLGYVE